MTIHHTKHHNTYVTNLNAALEKLDSAMSTSDVSAIIGLQGALKFNGTSGIQNYKATTPTWSYTSLPVGS